MVENGCRKLQVRDERRGTERLDPPGEAADERHNADKYRDDKGRPQSSLDTPRVLCPVHGGSCRGRRNCRQISHGEQLYLPATTSTAPVSLRPERSGRYMSSTLAWGRTYFPSDTARTTYATVKPAGSPRLRSNAAVKRSSRNSVLTGSTASVLQGSVPVSPDETRRGSSISKPAGR